MNEILANMKPTERLVMLALRSAYAPMSVTQLAESTGASPATLTLAVQTLVKRGLVTRTRIGSASHYGPTRQWRINGEGISCFDVLTGEMTYDWYFRAWPADRLAKFLAHVRCKKWFTDRDEAEILAAWNSKFGGAQ